MTCLHPTLINDQIHMENIMKSKLKEFLPVVVGLGAVGYLYAYLALDSKPTQAGYTIDAMERTETQLPGLRAVEKDPTRISPLLLKLNATGTLVHSDEVHWATFSKENTVAAIAEAEKEKQGVIQNTKGLIKQAKVVYNNALDQGHSSDEVKRAFFDVLERDYGDTIDALPILWDIAFNLNLPDDEIIINMNSQTSQLQKIEQMTRTLMWMAHVKVKPGTADYEYLKKLNTALFDMKNVFSKVEVLLVMRKYHE